MELKSLIQTQREPFDPSRRPLNVLFAASEVAPYSKTGGLGDVAAALPAALAQRGHNVSVITPLYSHLDPRALRLAQRIFTLEVPRQGLRRSKAEVTVWEGNMPGGPRIFFLENEELFGGDGLYGYDDDAADSAARFAFFSRAIVEFARSSSVPVDIIHCNDWHTALAPVYATHYYEEEFADRTFMLTIHNLAYQGQFDRDAFAETGLPKSRYLKAGSELLDEQGEGINFLRAGILFSDLVTTVSPTYAEEIQTEAGSCGLTETLRERADDLTGILNGVDYNIWSPAVDREIPVRYDVETLNGKRRNKAELQHAYALPIRPTLPMLGFVGRLTDQKGLDLLLPALRELLEGFSSEREGFQVVFLGEGEQRYREQLEALARDFPRRVGVQLGYAEQTAHQIQAGADILLIPSRFEPCGLTQIYALRYGTLPLVHRTGGLADTVTDASATGGGTGYVFDEFTHEALVEAIERATSTYRHYRRWRPLMINAMQQDFSWRESARSYESLYRDSLGLVDEAIEAE